MSRTRLAAVAAVAALLAGGGSVAPAHAAPGASAVLVSATAESAQGRPPVTDPAVGRRWRSDFATLQRDLSGPAGLSVVPVGATRGRTVGSLRTGVAWSTAKVPLSVAALQGKMSARERHRTEKLVHAAVTRSDNAAAESLWQRLGSGRKAAKAVQKVVRRAGDRDTVVQHRRVRRGFSAFGQTRWALDDQARFAAGLACLSDGGRVRNEMGNVVASQSFGLGRLSRTRIKGGWSPVGGDYLVRQVGIVEATDGRAWGVSIMVRSPDLARGSRDLTKIARWLDRHLGAVRGGSC